MHKTYIISDLHFGHKNIHNLSPQRGGSDSWEHDKWIIEQWNSIITKRDTVYILGDIAFTAVAVDRIKQLRGQKILIGGNHDKNLLRYADVVCSIHGCRVFKNYWLTHIPIHPSELRGRKNIHGHTHNVCIPDENYINVCVEMNNGIPILIDDIIEGRFTTHSLEGGSSTETT